MWCSALGVMMSQFKCNLQLATCVAHLVLTLGYWTSSNPEALNKRACIKCAQLQAWHHSRPQILPKGEFQCPHWQQWTHACHGLWAHYSKNTLEPLSRFMAVLFLYQTCHLPWSRQVTVQEHTHKQIQEATTRISHANTISGCTETWTVINLHIHITKATSLLC